MSNSSNARSDRLREYFFMRKGDCVERKVVLPEGVVRVGLTVGYVGMSNKQQYNKETSLLVSAKRMVGINFRSGGKLCV